MHISYYLYIYHVPIISLFIPYTKLRRCKERLKTRLTTESAWDVFLPADVSLKCILTGQACDYLPHVRRLSSNCFILGLDMLFCFHVSYYKASILSLFVCSRYKCIIICIYLIICTYIMYRLLVCLFHIQSCAAARNASKHFVPADVSLKCILTRQACNYLPCVYVVSSEISPL